MKIFPLSEGAFTIDSTKKFVPFNKVSDDLQTRPVGSLLVEIQPFLVITSTDVILVDTGLGFKIGNELQIHKNLAALGINPGDVTKVLLSHLHKDHSGGIAYINVDGEHQLAFPNAMYVVNKKEFEFGLANANKSYLPEQFKILESSKQVHFVNDNGSIEGGILYFLTGGHCPFHQVFTITDQNQTIFFGGDVAPQLQQMKNRFAAKYDFDGKRSMELRQGWWQEGKTKHWTFLFYHDIKSPMVSP